MKFSELCGQLPGKRRTVGDLARFVRTRTDDNPNYSLLLGAGCSISSGIRSAGALVSAWRSEVCHSLPGGDLVANRGADEQRDFLRASYSDWYNPNKEYACLFERRYDLQRQRRMFVESEVSKGFPSIGYAYLTSLVAQGYFRNIFTTNFDDLLNEAFYLYSYQRPIVCAHDSSINSITVTSKRPKVIKLHGDYLFDDIKATLRETESLEYNMQAKFSEFAKEAGIIVIGYSGSDRSIMDCLHGLLKRDDYLKAGVYWCLRADSDIPEELRRLFWKDRVYYVEIEGFDELFGDLYAGFNAGDVLPDSAITTTQRPNLLAERLVNSTTAIPETTAVLRKAKEKLSKQLTRSAIANLLVQSDGDERTSVQGRFQNLTDDELLILTEADNLMVDGKYGIALEKLRKALASHPRPYFQKRLLRLQIVALRYMHDTASALQVVDQLISLSGNLASIYLEKARIVNSRSKKLQALEKAVEVEPFSAAATLAKARFHSENAEETIGTDRQKELATALEMFEKCLELNPALNNPAWLGMFDAFGNIERDKAKRHGRQRELIHRVEKQNPESFVALKMLVKVATQAENNADCTKALDRIASVERRYGLEDCLWIVPLELEIYAYLRDEGKIRNRIDELVSKKIVSRDTDVAANVCKTIRNSLGDEALAEKILRESLRETDFDADVFVGLFQLLLDTRRTSEARELFDRWGDRLSDAFRYEVQCGLLEAEGKIEEALDSTRQWNADSESSDPSQELYLLVCARRFGDAEKLARQVLEPINYSPEAVAQIVNFELARRGQGKKVDVRRLEAALSMASDKITEAGIYALLDRKSDMLTALRESIRTDKTSRYLLIRWPVFEHVRGDKDVEQYINR